MGEPVRFKITNNLQYSIENINKRDEKAWESLFNAFYAPLCNYSEHFCNSHAIAEDIVQDTLVNIWKKDIAFKDSKHLTYYLYKSVYNNTMLHLRHKNNVVEITQEINESWSDDDFALTVREEMYRRMWSEIQKLPERRREVIMKSIEGKSLQQIADEMGVALSTVKETKARALQELRKATNHPPLLFLL